MATFQSRLNEALQLRDMKPTELSRLSGIAEGSISQYRKGKYKASQENLETLAKALNVPIAWLMGADVPLVGKNIYNYDNISPIETKRIPLLGEIAAGEPIFADQDYESYIEAGADIKADFCLRVRGESMKNIGIRDGYIVFIRQQPEVREGEVAAIIIDDEATLKRFYQYGDTVVLRAENPDFEEQIYPASECRNISILGKAVAFQGDVK